MVHLVYCDNESKEIDNLSDKKTMIIRGAAGRKIPHSRVFVGEVLYFMEKGSKKITATAIVKNVYNYTKLSENEISDILEKYEDKLLLTEKQKNRWHKKCLCLIEFENFKKITPLNFEHQNNMDDWLILNKIEDVVQGTSIPYNYKNSKF